MVSGSAPAPLRSASVPHPPSTSVTGIWSAALFDSDGVIHHLQGSLRNALRTAEILEGRGLEHDVTTHVFRLKQVKQAVLVERIRQSRRRGGDLIPEGGEETAPGAVLGADDLVIRALAPDVFIRGNGRQHGNIHR